MKYNKYIIVLIALALTSSISVECSDDSGTNSFNSKERYLGLNFQFGITNFVRPTTSATPPAKFLVESDDENIAGVLRAGFLYELILGDPRDELVSYSTGLSINIMMANLNFLIIDDEYLASIIVNHEQLHESVKYNSHSRFISISNSHMLKLFPFNDRFFVGGGVNLDFVLYQSFDETMTCEDKNRNICFDPDLEVWEHVHCQKLRLSPIQDDLFSKLNLGLLLNVGYKIFVEDTGKPNGPHNYLTPFVQVDYLVNQIERHNKNLTTWSFGCEFMF
jgi:hypothetical protein